ncbi:LysR family transcriptional regulator [Brachymonas denitrificans]|uniref:LysR family transcriptional regulator n=1 Tax=Brachymonas denitrificans TaxID=28220 RepID=UPI002AFDEEA3|nr:LysR family transcriptional regulator [Brachymonas denitrificans]
MPQSAIQDSLSPANLRMLQAVAEHGSFAAAARALDLVPSALSYRIRQMEEALDVLLFDRQGRQATPTAAACELLHESRLLLSEVDRIAHRVQRVATGWEPQLTIVIEDLLDMGTVFELCEAFYALGAPTRLKLRSEVMTGTFEVLASGQADLALGVLLDSGWTDRLIEHRPLGHIDFIYAVAPHHPLAAITTPLTPQDMQPYRAVAVADTVHRSNSRTVGLITGQDVLTVPDMGAKIEAQVRGLGVGYVPITRVQAQLQSGLLVQKTLAQPQRDTHFNSHYAWHRGKQRHGQALQWWLEQLQSPVTRQALLQGRELEAGLPARQVAE